MTEMLNSKAFLPALILCLGIFFIVRLFRQWCENVWPSLKKQKNGLWDGFILPAAPIVFGGVFAAVVKSYPYPAVFASDTWARIFFGVSAGGFSGWLYRLVRQTLAKKASAKLDVPLQDDSVDSAPVSDTPESKQP